MLHEGEKLDRREFFVKTLMGTSALAATGCDMASGQATVSAVPDPVVPIPRQFQSWDAGSGPNRDYWSHKLLLPWVNRGPGDWIDGSQTPLGNRPYASATVSGGSVKLNVTALVSRWLETGINRGFYLRSGQLWPFTFAGRNFATLSARPQLTVVTSAGTRNLECVSNAGWTTSSSLSRNTQQTFSVAKNNAFAALQFDMSGVTGPIQSALLTLNCVSLKYPGTLEIFELNPPAFRIGGGDLPSQPGIAANYLFDQGLSGHPDVLFAGDFSDLTKSRWQVGQIVLPALQVKDARTGTTYVRGQIPKGGLLGSDLQRVVARGTPAGIPILTESELYGRYYVFLEEDWGSQVDANKMPGWDGRFGWWNQVGYWQSTTGNGGTRPTGLKVRNVTANRWEYQGASMRGHGGTRANDGNPYDDLFWIGNYIYHLDQASNYGEPINWTGTVISKGRWHCIEQHIKMNSITGPFDANGNGIAVRDGQFRTWIDGVPAYERKNFRWRRHPEMGIQSFWLNWYHGGTAPSPTTMHFRMDSVVLARSYIGPRNEGS